MTSPYNTNYGATQPKLDYEDRQALASGRGNYYTTLRSSTRDGWISVGGRATYASSSSITVDFDPTTWITHCIRIRLKQAAGTYKYFIISGVVGATKTINFVPSTTYSVVNEPIKDVCYSFVEKPIGMPGTLDYIPTWSSLSSPQPSLGDGSIGSRFWNHGSHMFVKITLSIGTTTTMGTGAWYFSLPSTAGSTSGYLLGAMAIDAGGPYMAGLSYPYSTTGVLARFPDYSSASNHNAVLVSPTTPFTWANGDKLEITYAYDMA